MAKIPTMDEGGNEPQLPRMQTGSAPNLPAYDARGAWDAAARTFDQAREGIKRIKLASMENEVSAAKTESIKIAGQQALEANEMPTSASVQYFSETTKEKFEAQLDGIDNPVVREKVKLAQEAVMADRGLSVQSTTFRRAVPEQEAQFYARGTQLFDNFKKNSNILEYVTGVAELGQEIQEHSLLATENERFLQSRKFTSAAYGEVIETKLSALESLEGLELAAAVEELRGVLSQIPTDELGGAYNKKTEKELNTYEQKATVEQAGNYESMVNQTKVDAKEATTLAEIEKHAEKIFEVNSQRGLRNAPKENSRIYSELLGVFFTDNVDAFHDTAGLEKMLSMVEKNAVKKYGVSINVDSIRAQVLAKAKFENDQATKELRKTLLDFTAGSKRIDNMTAAMFKTSIANRMNMVGETTGQDVYSDVFGERMVNAMSLGALGNIQEYELAQDLFKLFEEEGHISSSRYVQAKKIEANYLKSIAPDELDEPSEQELRTKALIQWGLQSGPNDPLPTTLDSVDVRELNKSIDDLPVEDRIEIKKRYARAGKDVGMKEELETLLEHHSVSDFVESIIDISKDMPESSVLNGISKGTPLRSMVETVLDGTDQELTLLSTTINTTDAQEELSKANDLVNNFMIAFSAADQESDVIKEKELVNQELRSVVRGILYKQDHSKGFNFGDRETWSNRIALQLFSEMKSRSINHEDWDGLEMGMKKELLTKAVTTLGQLNSQGAVQTGYGSISNRRLQNFNMNPKQVLTFSRIMTSSRGAEGYDEFVEYAVEEGKKASRDYAESESGRSLFGGGHMSVGVERQEEVLRGGEYSQQYFIDSSMNMVRHNHPSAVLDVQNIVVLEPETTTQGIYTKVGIPMFEDTGKYIGMISFEIKEDGTWRVPRVKRGDFKEKVGNGILSTRMEWQNFNEEGVAGISFQEEELLQAMKYTNRGVQYGPNRYAAVPGQTIDVRHAMLRFGPLAKRIIGNDVQDPEQFTDVILSLASTYGWEVVSSLGDRDATTK